MITFETIKIKAVFEGCTDPEAPNYDPNASVDNGSCISKTFGDCVNNSIQSLSLQDCTHQESNRYLKIFSVYQSLLGAIGEKNSYKVDMYNKKLAELCDSEYCKNC